MPLQRSLNIKIVKITPMNSEHVKKLLSELNELEQKYGRVQAEHNANYDPSGEANARIQLLKDELKKIGVRLKWDGWQYHCIKE